MINYFVGVDPGAAGGLAVVQKDSYGKAKFIKARSMPTTKTSGKPSLDTRALETFFPHETFIAILEQVGARPGQGVSSMFQFGRMFGGIEAMLDATAKEIFYIWPQKMEKIFRNRGGQEGKQLPAPTNTLAEKNSGTGEDGTAA